MAEGNGHGGARQGAGRKPKSEEAALIERLSPMDDLAFNALKNGLEAEDPGCLKLFMAYRFGQPKQIVEMDARVEEIKTPSWFMNQDHIMTTNGQAKES